MKTKRQIQGKKNRASGARFELKVRKDLESKGWIVAKWSNNVEFDSHKEKVSTAGSSMVRSISATNIPGFDSPNCGKLISAKHKFRGIGIPMAMGTGFPDFICFRPVKKVHIMFDKHDFEKPFPYIIVGVEVKSNGYLSKEEKEKCQWLLENNIFSKILIASKSEKRGKINYKEVQKMTEEETKPEPEAVTDEEDESEAEEDKEDEE